MGIISLVSLHLKQLLLFAQTSLLYLKITALAISFPGTGILETEISVLHKHHRRNPIFRQGLPWMFFQD
jgi:hypothetical protein